MRHVPPPPCYGTPPADLLPPPPRLSLSLGDPDHLPGRLQDADGEVLRRRQRAPRELPQLGAVVGPVEDHLCGARASVVLLHRRSGRGAHSPHRCSCWSAPTAWSRGSGPPRRATSLSAPAWRPPASRRSPGPPRPRPSAPARPPRSGAPRTPPPGSSSAPPPPRSPCPGPPSRSPPGCSAARGRSARWPCPAGPPPPRGRPTAPAPWRTRPPPRRGSPQGSSPSRCSPG